MHVFRQKLYMKIIYHNISASSYEIFIPFPVYWHKLESYVILLPILCTLLLCVVLTWADFISSMECTTILHITWPIGIANAGMKSHTSRINVALVRRSSRVDLELQNQWTEIVFHIILARIQFIILSLALQF